MIRPRIPAVSSRSLLASGVGERLALTAVLVGALWLALLWTAGS